MLTPGSNVPWVNSPRSRPTPTSPPASAIRFSRRDRRGPSPSRATRSVTADPGRAPSTDGSAVGLDAMAHSPTCPASPGRLTPTSSASRTLARAAGSPARTRGTADAAVDRVMGTHPADPPGRSQAGCNEAVRRHDHPQLERGEPRAARGDGDDDVVDGRRGDPHAGHVGVPREVDVGEAVPLLLVGSVGVEVFQAVGVALPPTVQQVSPTIPGGDTAHSATPPD